nr:MAM and LDL-receptor class A domain-containing protein 1-like [Lytechinus pictus]
MYGEHIGELNVYAEDLVSEIRGLEWNMTGNQGNQWVKGQINLNQVTGFSIIFEGVVGTGSTGDIAIDDVFFLPDQTCNDTSPVNCDFEDDWCDYSQDDSEDFDWRRMQGTSQPNDKYPKIDHTLGDGTGWYLYIDTSSQSTGDIARILTPLQPVTSQQCLTLWYHMFGASLETLNIYLRRNDANDSYVGDLVWRTQGDRADQWLEAQISVAEAVPYQVVFEGRVGSAFTGDISLDDISMIHGYCPGTPGCDFEDPFLCGYLQDSSDDDIDWIYWQGSTPTPNTGPSFDALYGNNRYEFLTNHLYDQGNKWHEGAVQISLPEYDLVFDGLLGSGFQRDIAIDEISMTRTSCEDCDFESDFCGWVNAANGRDQLDWQRQSGSTTTPQTGPLNDHTTLSDTGFYIYIDGSFPSRQGDIAKISSTVSLVTRTHTCFSFWYMMHGQDIGELRLLKTEAGLEETVWSLKGEQNNDNTVWKQGKIQYSDAQDKVKMEFWGIVGSSDLSDIALDDIKLIPGECDTYPPEAAVVPTTTPAPPTTPPPSGTQSCDFESDFCDFVQSTDDDFDWRRGQGSTSTSGTGPSYDHTRGDALGSYIYTEGFFVNRRHHLESRLFPSTMISCVTFWYHMWGSTMGDLNVYGKEGTALGQPLWTREGSLADQWFEAQVQYAPKANYRIVFEGLTGSGQQSDMALDDIDIQPGYCPVSETCTFENPDICTFKQDFDDEYDWTWFNGPTPTLYTGPSVDVTYGTNSGKSAVMCTNPLVLLNGTNKLDLFGTTTDRHYVYASAYERLEGDRARLQSREIIHDTDQTEYCVSFYYHMFGTEMGTLNIRLIEGNQEVSTPLWTQGTEDLSDHWYMGEVSLSSALTFRVVFEAIRGSGDMSDIAIDDVTISNEVCHGLGK